MALVEWTEDYGQYKKGDQFPLNDKASRDYLVKSGKLKIVDENYFNETVSNPVPTQEEREAATKAVISSTDSGKTAKKSEK